MSELLCYGIIIFAIVTGLSSFTGGNKKPKHRRNNY